MESLREDTVEQNSLEILSELYEYHPPIYVKLEQEDADFLRNNLRFRMASPWEDGRYHVEVGPQVCRAVLPISGATVWVSPKLSIRNIFAMLGVAYGLYTEKHEDPFEDIQVVGYEAAPELFETLVRHFLDLIEEKLLSGLIADYVIREDNLFTIRGRVAFDLQVRSNVVRRDRVYCRFSEFLRDIPENRILLWTLFILSRMGFWTTDTRHSIFSTIRQFHDVSLTPFRKANFPVFHYHRLNESYRVLHHWSKLLLNAAAFSDRPGDLSFQGFVLNMNELFEDFVIQALLDHSLGFEIKPKARSLLFENHADQIEPDILVLKNGRPVAVVDAKYKRISDDEFKNFDVYQVISYATTLKVDRAFLIYPDTEFSSAWQGKVVGSPLRVSVQTVSLSQGEVSMREQAEVLARNVLGELTRPAVVP